MSACNCASNVGDWLVKKMVCTYNPVPSVYMKHLVKLCETFHFCYLNDRFQPLMVDIPHFWAVEIPGNCVPVGYTCRIVLNRELPVDSQRTFALHLLPESKTKHVYCRVSFCHFCFNAMSWNCAACSLFGLQWIDMGRGLPLHLQL